MQAKGWLVLVAGIIFAQPVFGQIASEKQIVKRLKKDIKYLASDKLEGRRTGSEGEKLAAEHIIEFYKDNGIATYDKGDLKGKYRFPFTFTAGRSLGEGNKIMVNGQLLDLKKDAFPVTFSGNGSVEGEAIPGVMEKGKIWMTPLFKDEEQAKDPHFNWEKSAFEASEKAVKSGATAVVFYDQYDAKYPAELNNRTEYEALSIPVIYITNEGYKKFVSPSDKAEQTPSVKLNITTRLEDKEMTGNNVIGYIDNSSKGAQYTVVIGAHYDHLGRGEDGNSLHAAKDGSIHNGADDNASGTAALMQLATWIKKDELRKYNYMFIHFSAEELGLIGSKKIVEKLGLDSTNVAYMINMDMVGRLNDSTHALTVGGVGTSPMWGKVVNVNDERFKIVVDSSGVGPSDHSSFYYQNIPVLFFFTGTHSDYHKPSDDANKINYDGEAQIMLYMYSIIKRMDFVAKPTFTKTKQKSVGKVRFKVTMGIMPDYSFTDGGLRIDGVTDGRPAMNAGLKGGDIITKLGDFEIRGIQTYMEALSEFEEGDKTMVTVKREGKEVTMPLEFTPKK